MRIRFFAWITVNTLKKLSLIHISIVQRHTGFKEAGRVPGPDLMPEIFRLSEKKGYRHYFYGSRQETLDALKVKLAEEYPKMNVVGMYSPPFRPMTEEEDEEAIRNINECNPDFIWIGLGKEKKISWYIILCIFRLEQIM